MKAIILAAGKGTRLHPLTQEIPKPLICIHSKPIINRIFESLPDQINEVIIVVDYLKERIESHIGDLFYGKKIYYVTQGEMRGTFGALFSARIFLDADERFLVLNGDDINSKEELQKYLEQPRSFGIQKMIMPNYYNIRVTDNGEIEGFYPQNEDEKNQGTFVATGVYFIDSHIFEHPGIILRDGEYGLPHTLLAQKEMYPLHAVVGTKWIPINSFKDIEAAERTLKEIDFNRPLL